MKIKKELSLNKILSLFNGLVFFLILYILIFNSDIDANPYINKATLFLALLLSLQILIILNIERRRPNRFILILAYVIMVYYSFRIFTITLYPYSIVFDRIGVYSPADSNNALLIIIFSTLFLALGLFSVGRKDIKIYGENKIRQPKHGFIFLIFLIFLIFIQSSTITNLGVISQVISIILLFFTPLNVFIICAAYVITYQIYIKPSYIFILICIGIILFINQTLGGSRAAFFTYFHYLFFLMLAVKPDVRIKTSTFFVCIGVTPILVAILTSIFVISTLSRSVVHDKDSSLTISQKYEIFKGVSESTQFVEKIDDISGLMLARAGYFDFTSEIISHRKEYSELFTLESYTKSLVDNVLTPGFDLFDFPKISNGLSQVYYGYSGLSKKSVSDAYQSDQISIFAELFSLFGYFSFLLLYFLGVLFQKLYLNENGDSKFIVSLRRLFLLIIFHSILLSFGLDWIILDAFLLFSCMFLMRVLLFNGAISYK